MAERQNGTQENSAQPAPNAGAQATYPAESVAAAAAAAAAAADDIQMVENPTTPNPPTTPVNPVITVPPQTPQRTAPSRDFTYSPPTQVGKKRPDPNFTP